MLLQVKGDCIGYGSECDKASLRTKDQRMGSKRGVSDYISNLPEILIEKILMCLPLKDAARTSVLSSVWRYNWRKLPALVFDERLCNKARTRSSPQLIMIIYQVLLAHNGPIHKFVLDIPMVQGCSEIDQIVRYIFSKGIEDFTFHIHRGEPRELPLSLFSCQQLTHLDLRFCHLTPFSSFKGFSNLVSLKFSQMAVTTKTLENLISNSPKLEHLALENSASWDSLEVVSNSLKYFYLKAFCKSISFKTVTALATISICLRDHTYEERRKSTIFSFFESIPIISIISSLHLDRHYLQSYVTGLYPGTFEPIKDLKLSDIRLGMEIDINNVLTVIAHCPNLKTVTIEVCPSGNDAGDSLKEFYESLWKRNFSFFSAPEVEIRHVFDLGHALEFIEILLAKLPELEKMHIKPNMKMVQDQGMNILKRVTQFRRASPKAVIKFNNHV